MASARQINPLVDHTSGRSGAQLLIDALRAQGVDVIFGHPGGAALPLYDALYDAHDLTHVLVRHEQVAAHAAVGYARASGKVGVCMATSGPGATNMITGIADAYMDSIPIVAITGQVPTAVIGRDAFQEADVMGITMPITKHSYLVRSVDELGDTVADAFAIAGSGRPGPALVDIPRDISQTVSRATSSSTHRKTEPREPSSRQIEAAAEMLSNAQRPIIYAGGGIISADASAELTRLVDLTGIPVTVTLMGKGGIDEHHPRCLGMLGMHGTVYANYAVNAADVILAVGVRFDDRVTGRLKDFAPGARFIHIDIDPAEIGKNKPAHVPIVGDARTALAALSRAMAAVARPQIEPWLRQIEEWRERYPLKFRQGDDTIKPQFVCEMTARLTNERAIVVADVGQHQMWAAQFYRCREPRTFISSGGLGAMGFGFPAAIGAQVAAPAKTVVALVGDGGFQMTMQDLITAVQARLPLKIFVINNGSLGMVRQWQEFFYHRRFSHVFLANPDFGRVAEVFGAKGRSVRRPDEVEDSIRWALEISDGPCVIDFHVDPQENCLPMIPSGQSIKEMIIE